MTFLAAVIVAVLGALAGAALRPFMEDLYGRRTKRILVELPADMRSNIELPYDMKIEWQGEVHKRYNEQAFFVKNTTSKTIRNVDLIVESNCLHEIEPGIEQYIYDILVDFILPNKAEVVAIAGVPFSRIIRVENLEPNKSIGGRIVATIDHKISFRTKDDFEIIVSRKSKLDGAKDYQKYSFAVSSILSTLSVAIAISALAGLSEIDLVEIIRNWIR